jgi:hypothetical protein
MDRGIIRDTQETFLEIPYEFASIFCPTEGE